MGGVKLQVREEDVPAALELLRRPPGALAALGEDAAAPEATPEGGVAMPRCPTCGAQAAAFEESAPMGFLIEWLERLIPLPLLHGRFVCGECGKRWIE